MNKYIYIRVSSKDQNISRQLEDVKKLNIPEENVFIDKQSGKDFNRPEYQRLISTLQEGDIVYFHSIDRMGRNYDMIIEEWNRITKTIKADIIILDMPLLDTTTKNSDLTGKLIADIVLQLLSYVAQREREAIKQRQAEGIAIAVEEGKFRKTAATDDDIRRYMAKVEAKEMTVVQACKELGFSKRTWYTRIKNL